MSGIVLLLYHPYTTMRQVLRRTIRAVSPTVQIFEAANRDAAIELIETQQVTAVVADAKLFRASASRGSEAVLGGKLELPVIVLKSSESQRFHPRPARTTLYVNTLRELQHSITMLNPLAVSVDGQPSCPAGPTSAIFAS